MRQTPAKTQVSFTVDGPFQVQLEDLENEIIASTLDPRWLVQVSVPAAAVKADLKAAIELARFIADCCQGSVYDPQEGQVVWPRRKTARFIAPSNETRIRLVKLDWFMPASQRSITTATTMLQGLRRTCPETLPTRFGTFEPLQYRLESGEDEPFIRLWNQQSELEFGGSCFWKSEESVLQRAYFFS
jgi:hypothetical protein